MFIGVSFRSVIAVCVIVANMELGLAEDGGLTDLHVAALLPMSKHWWSKYAKLIPALLNHVFDEVANRTDLLPGYRLKLTVVDTQGLPGLAFKRFEELVNEAPTKLAVFGPCMSNEANVIGQATHYYNMVEMMFLARTSALVNRKQYPSVYLTNYLEEVFNPPRIALMKHFGWRRVATLSSSYDIYATNIDNFHAMLEVNNFTLVTSGVITNKLQVAEHIRRLKAYKQGFYGRQIVWVLPVSYNLAKWMDKSPADVSCTSEQLDIASNGYLFLENTNWGMTNKTTVSGKSPEDLSALIKELANGSSVTTVAPFAYDAAWALALALNQTSAGLPLNMSLSNFSYDNSYIYQSLKEHLESISFMGVSGPVAFGKDGQRLGPTFLSQYVDDKVIRAAVYDPHLDQLTWKVDPNILWEGGRPPKDQFTYVERYPKIHISAVISMIVLSSAGIVIALVFLIFNIVFRSHRAIKMSSPNMNNIIIVGCLIMFTTVFLDSSEFWDDPPLHLSRLCMVRVWITSLGFTISFGAIFSKTWRVHILFRNIQPKRKSMRDEKLFGLVALLLMVDLIILVPWTIFNPLVEKHKQFAQQELSAGDVIATEMYIVCFHDNQLYWLASEYLYKGLLLVFGTFLAWETRNVSIPGLNDSKQIGFCVYNVVVICAFGVPINHVLTDNQSTLRYVITSCLTIFCTTLILCIVFVPKILRRHEKTTDMFITTGGSVKPRQQVSSDAERGSQLQGSNTVRLFQVPGDSTAGENIEHGRTPGRILLYSFADLL